MTFYLSIEPGFEGDIDIIAKEDGSSRESSVAIATAVSPFTVESSSTSTPIGVKNMEVADIIIRETVAGAISKTGSNVYDGDDSNGSAETLVIAVEDMGIDTNSAQVEVTDGDMVIEKVNYISTSIGSYGSRNNNKGLGITVKRESNKASTIRISGITISVDRTLAQGDYELRVGGIVCANYSDRSKLIEGTFDKEYYSVYDHYVTVTTAEGNPGDSNNGTNTNGQVVRVTIGESQMQVGSETVYLDAPAFIRNNYTYIPVSAVASALGIDSNNVIWNPYEKSVTIFNGSRTVKMTHNSNVLIINGIETYVEAPMIINNNRACLPFRVLGEMVLGVPVSWDESSRTATFN